MDIRRIGQPHSLSAGKVGVIGIFVVLFLGMLLGISIPAAQAHTLAGASAYNRVHSNVRGNVHAQSRVSNHNANLTVHSGVAIHNDASVAGMIYEVFGPHAPSAMNIARCESGFNPNAYNPQPVLGSHAMGVFQILYPSTWMTTPQAASSPYDARANILAAHAIFVRDGYSWREWECRP